MQTSGLAGAVAFISGSQMMAEYAADKAGEAQRTTGALEHTGNDGAGWQPTDLSNGVVLAVLRYDAATKSYHLHTMYPDPR